MITNKLEHEQHFDGTYVVYKKNIPNLVLCVYITHVLELVVVKQKSYTFSWHMLSASKQLKAFIEEENRSRA